MNASVVPQLPATEREFVQLFSATARGARLARRLAAHTLDGWGFAHGSALSYAAGVLVGELAANAATHGRVPGRNFELRLALTADALWIEVSDTRSERRPPEPGSVRTPEPLAESGRGLVLVEAVADRWTVLDRDAVGKTVRAELDLARRNSTFP